MRRLDKAIPHSIFVCPRTCGLLLSLVATLCIYLPLHSEDLDPIPSFTTGDKEIDELLSTARFGVIKSATSSLIPRGYSSVIRVTNRGNNPAPLRFSFNGSTPYRVRETATAAFMGRGNAGRISQRSVQIAWIGKLSCTYEPLVQLGTTTRELESLEIDPLPGHVSPQFTSRGNDFLQKIIGQRWRVLSASTGEVRRRYQEGNFNKRGQTEDVDFIHFGRFGGGSFQFPVESVGIGASWVEVRREANDGPKPAELTCRKITLLALSASVARISVIARGYILKDEMVSKTKQNVVYKDLRLDSNSDGWMDLNLQLGGPIAGEWRRVDDLDTQEITNGVGGVIKKYRYSWQCEIAREP